MWVKCVAATILIAVANGPIVAWQTLEPIMLADGVFRHETRDGAIKILDTMNSNACAVGQASCIVGGIVFDRFGPRFSACFGSFMTAVCLFGMGASIQDPALNWMLGPSYVACVFFAFLNSFGAVYFLIKLTSYPSLVAAIGACSFALGDAVGIVGAVLHSRIGLTSWMFYYCMSVGAIVSTGALYLIFPPNHIFVVERREHEEQEDERGGEPAVELGIPAAVRTSLYLFRLLPGLGLVNLHLCALYMLMMGLQVHQYQLYIALFGDKVAEYLVNLSSAIFSSAGVAALLLWGFLSDFVSQRLAWITIDFCAILFSLCLLFPMMPSQIGGQVMYSLMVNLVSNMLPYRIAVSYAPGKLLGTVSGLLWLFQGLVQLIITPLQERVALRVFPEKSGARIYAVLIMWMLISLISGLVMHGYFCRHGIPKDGSISMKYIEDSRPQERRPSPHEVELAGVHNE